MHIPKYVLVTPARNEAAFIEKTIQSVIAQTVLPVKWVIVSDGSTDRTDDIARQYTAKNHWMELIRMSERRDRNFAAKVACFNAGYAHLNGIDYEIIGNLDGDISFEGDYIEFLLKQFQENSRLGVAGTPFLETGNTSYNYNFVNIEHVSGACQLFRRQCFENIGGYIPIKGGGIDWVAVTSARMKGWQTRTFTEKSCVHHRPMGTGAGNICRARFNLGKEDFYVGGHPLWEICRTLFQLKEKPYIIGSFCLLSGYFWAALSGMERPVPQDLVAFHRSEQMERLKTILRRTIGLG
jgi:biofilm PGA synthesis N-glycosyltransferase PgaC